MTDSGGAQGDMSSSTSPAAAPQIPAGLSSPASAVVQAGQERDQKPSARWNTKNLPSRIAADIFSAGCAAGLVAPVIATIDRGIMENASGKATLKDSIIKSLKTLFLRPHKFFTSRPFALIFTVYGGTYIMANTIDTASSTLANKPASSVTHGTSKFVSTSAANVGLSMWKDAQFTQLFGTTKPRAIPLPTFALFALRDSLTIFASFNVPPLLAPYIPTHALPTFMRKFEAQSIAQFAAPAAIQLVSTPMHLLGLDIYNRKDAIAAERARQVRKAWFQSTMARICRIVPAFGIGGVVNTRVRKDLMTRFQ